jgi:(p)ppGpp synthase/HD superfamily hydrolase
MEIITTDIVERATFVAVVAHKEQVRKSDGSPYIVHPLMVARIVASHNFPDVVVAAALVHDVLEDSPITKDELTNLLNEEVVAIVTAVSEDKSLPWKDRKLQYIKAVSVSGEYVKAVSVADKIHNAQSLRDAHAKFGSSVWERFNQGRDIKIWFERTLCDQLEQNWQHPLLQEYKTLVSELEKLS